MTTWHEPRSASTGVELAPHMDAWMMGDRYGTIVGARSAGARTRDEESVSYV